MRNHFVAHYSSAAAGFLCLGFLRRFLGTISRAGLTLPTRSRAIALISLGTFTLLIFFCFGGFMID